MLKTREGRTIGSGRIIGIARCAEMLDVHPNTVRNRVADGTLPASMTAGFCYARRTTVGA
jgi:hypothetical protein